MSLRRSCTALGARKRRGAGAGSLRASASAMPPLFLLPCLARPPPVPPPQARAASSSSALQLPDRKSKTALGNYFNSLWAPHADADHAASASGDAASSPGEAAGPDRVLKKQQRAFRDAARQGDPDRLLELYPHLAAGAFARDWLTLSPSDLWAAAAALLRQSRPHWRSEALVAPTATRRERLQQSVMLRHARMAVRILRDAPTLWNVDHNGDSLSLLLDALAAAANDASLEHLLHLRRRLMAEYPDAGAPADIATSVLRAAWLTRDASGLRTLLEQRSASLQAQSAKWYARALQLLLRRGEADFALKRAAAPPTNGNLLSVVPLAVADSQMLSTIVATSTRVGLADRSLVCAAAAELHKRIRKDAGASDQVWHALILHASQKKDAEDGEVPRILSQMARLRTTRPRAALSLFALLLHTHSAALYAAADATEEDILQLFARVKRMSGTAPDMDAYAIGIRALLGNITPLREDGTPTPRPKATPLSKGQEGLGEQREPSPSHVSSPEQRYEAAALYGRYLDGGGKAHAAVTGPLIGAWTDAFLPDPARALQYLDDLRAESVEDVPAVLYVQVLEACQRASDWLNARKVLQRMHDDKVILTQLERKLASEVGMLGAPHPEQALEAYRMLRDLPRLPGQAPYEAKHWIRLFSLYSLICKAFRPRVTDEFYVAAPTALGFLRDILRAGYDLDPGLLGTLLDLCSTAAKHYRQLSHARREEVRERMAELAATVHQLDELIPMMSRNKPPDIGLTTALMNAYNCIGDYERMLEIWYRLLAYRVPIDMPTLSVVLDACGYAGYYRQGMEAWQLACRAVGLEHMNANAWLSYVEFLARCQHLRAAIDVTFGEMREALLAHPKKGQDAVQGVYGPAVEMLHRFTLYRRDAGHGDEELQHIRERIRNDAPWLSHLLK